MQSGTPGKMCLAIVRLCRSQIVSGTEFKKCVALRGVELEFEMGWGETLRE
jgi:hypothetical protein